MKYHSITMTIILCLTAIACRAQDKPLFQGEVTWKTMIMGNMATDYKGKHIIKVVYKNGSKHEYDTRLGKHVVMLPAEDRFIVYYDELKAGAEYPLNKYYSIGHMNSAYGISQEGEFYKTDKTTQICGYDCVIYEGTKSINQDYKAAKLQKASTVIYHYAVCEKFDVDSIWQKKNPDMPSSGLLLKMVLDQKQNVKNALIKGKGNYYHSEVVTEVVEREVDDAELCVPNDIEIQKFRTFPSASPRLAELYTQNKAALKKKGLFPTQLPDNDTFDTDSEWDDE